MKFSLLRKLDKRMYVLEKELFGHHINETFFLLTDEYNMGSFVLLI